MSSGLLKPEARHEVLTPLPASFLTIMFNDLSV